jgi:hypothetical protein
MAENASQQLRLMTCSKQHVAQEAQTTIIQSGPSFCDKGIDRPFVTKALISSSSLLPQ